MTNDTLNFKNRQSDVLLSSGDIDKSCSLKIYCGLLQGIMQQDNKREAFGWLRTLNGIPLLSP